MQEKKHQQINIKIPIDIWDKIEIGFLKKKQEDPARSLSKESYIIGVLDNGIKSKWT